jgi:signal transduction histidine kinase
VVRDISSPPSHIVTRLLPARLDWRAPALRRPPRLITDGWRHTSRLRRWPWWLDFSWVAFWLIGLAGIVIFAHWAAIPFHLIWIGFALFYGFRVRRTSATVWILAAMIATTLAAIGLDVWHRGQPADELAEVPLMAALLWVMMWHAHRTMAADAERAAVSEENARLLETQRRFLQDASHQLRTPITIALGHAELLARDLAGRPGQRDIHVVVGELTRLKSLAERLLLIAASENPDFLRLEPVTLDCFVMEVLRRWRPTAGRLWRLGHLDAITITADRERLGLAIDALLENAIQHTGPADVIRLSVRLIDHAAHLIIEDTGAGIPRGELARIFDRFTTSPGAGGHRGTGLGLPLVRAIARGHGGEVRVRSALGEGSKFEFMLPVTAPSADGLVHLPMPAHAGDPSGIRRP